MPVEALMNKPPGLPGTGVSAKPSASASARTTSSVGEGIMAHTLLGHKLPMAVDIRNMYFPDRQSGRAAIRRVRSPGTSALALRDSARRRRLVRSVRITQGSPHLILLLHGEI